MSYPIFYPILSSLPNPILLSYPYPYPYPYPYRLLSLSYLLLIVRVPFPILFKNPLGRTRAIRIPKHRETGG